jgi:hypothetical protein
MLIAAAYAKTDITAFVNTIDAFNDLFLHNLAQADTSIGTYQLGNIGGFLNRARLCRISILKLIKCARSYMTREKNLSCHIL